jgi:2-keto-3-deoxy-L-rhamnonate aldolase RhmA
MGSVAKVKEKLRSGDVAIGSWLTLGSPSSAEIMAHAGFDFLIIDGEHTAAGLDTVQHILQAMNGTDTVPVLRVPWNDKTLIKVALDVGVKGIMAPMVNTRQEAIDAVAACKYPPEGVRGIGPGRASLFGKHTKEYLTTANEDLLTLIIVEHEQAVENIEEIVSVEGLDAVFFGYFDYAASIGLRHQPGHTRVIEARDKVLAATKRAKVAAAYAAGTPAQAKELIQLGFRFITLGGDANFVITGADRAIAEIKA